MHAASVGRWSILSPSRNEGGNAGYSQESCPQTLGQPLSRPKSASTVTDATVRPATPGVLRRAALRASFARAIRLLQSGLTAPPLRSIILLVGRRAPPVDGTSGAGSCDPSARRGMCGRREVLVYLNTGHAILFAGQTDACDRIRMPVVPALGWTHHSQLLGVGRRAPGGDGLTYRLALRSGFQEGAAFYRRSRRHQEEDSARRASPGGDHREAAAKSV
jgi:hypothetical protein